MSLVDYLATLDGQVAAALFTVTFLGACLLLAVARRLSRS